MDHTITPSLLVVDRDPAFAAEARRLLDGAYDVSIAASIEEAADRAGAFRFDLALLGPSLANPGAIDAAGLMLAADPGLAVALCADVISNRILLDALRVGFVDVVASPITADKAAGILQRAAPRRADDGVVLIDDRPSAGEGPVTGASAIASFTVQASPSEDDPWAEPIQAPPPQRTDPIRESEVPAETVLTVENGVPHLAEETPVAGDASAPPGIDHDAVDADEPLVVPLQPIELSALSDEATVPPWAPPTQEEPPPSGPIDEVVAETELPGAHDHEDEPAPDEVPVVIPMAPVDDLDEWTPPSNDEIEALADSIAGLRPRAYEAPVDPLGLALPPEPADPGPPAYRHGTVVAVTSGKGGSGKSVTATNLAVTLARERGDDTVVLVDTDLDSGDVGLMLKIDPMYDVAAVAERIDDMSDDRLDGMTLRHESGLRVIPAPGHRGVSGRIDAKALVAVIERLRRVFDVIVVDTKTAYDDDLVTVLDACDLVLLVVDMDVPSVKDARMVLDDLRGSGFPVERMRLVMNRANAKARLDVEEIERSLRLEVAGSIPSDRLLPQSVNEGVPAVGLKPRSRVARAFRSLASLLDLPDEA